MNNVNWAQAVVGASIGLILGVLFSDIFKLAISAAIQKLFEPAARQIAGTWETSYWYIDDKGQRIEQNDIVKLRQIGTYVFGRNESSKRDRYKISGRLRNQVFFTGTWKSLIKSDTYHGPFQLIVNSMVTLCGGNGLGQLIQTVSIMANGGGRSKPNKSRCRKKRSLTLNVRTIDDQWCFSLPTSSVNGLTSQT
jgi:hypothetical protein